MACPFTAGPMVAVMCTASTDLLNPSLTKSSPFVSMALWRTFWLPCPRQITLGLSKITQVHVLNATYTTSFTHGIHRQDYQIPFPFECSINESMTILSAFFFIVPLCLSFFVGFSALFLREVFTPCLFLLYFSSSFFFFPISHFNFRCSPFLWDPNRSDIASTSMEFVILHDGVRAVGRGCSQPNPVRFKIVSQPHPCKLGTWKRGAGHLRPEDAHDRHDMRWQQRQW